MLLRLEWEGGCGGEKLGAEAGKMTGYRERGRGKMVETSYDVLRLAGGNFL